MPALKYLRSYVQEPELANRVLPLLDLSFPTIVPWLENAKILGSDFFQVSTPFLCFEGERLVAHLGVIDIPLMINGHEMVVSDLHAICTHPDFRGRGYSRAIMEEALEWCAVRSAATVLFTGRTFLYERYGFRAVRESRFVARGAWPASGSKIPLRALNLRQPDDLAILHRLLAERAPVSRRLGVVHERAAFLFNAVNQPLYYAEGSDFVVATETEGTILRLYDVVAKRMPTLAEIMAHGETPIDRVEIYFAPDGLEADFIAEPHVLDGGSYFMVRGDLDINGQSVMLPRMARY